MNSRIRGSATQAATARFAAQPSPSSARETPGRKRAGDGGEVVGMVAGAQQGGCHPDGVPHKFSCAPVPVSGPCSTLAPMLRSLLAIALLATPDAGPWVLRPV